MIIIDCHYEVIWKGIKWIFKIVVGIILLIFIAYGLFLAVEYITGNKFVDYLKKNSDTVAIGDSFDFSKFDNSFSENDLILVGEIHGFHEPQIVDYNLFTYLHKKHKVNFYFAEVDLVQAHYLNEYLKTGQEEHLDSALKKWAVIQGRDNESYYNKYRKLHNYFTEQDSSSKFKIIGVDKLQDKSLVKHYLSGLGVSFDSTSKTWEQIKTATVQLTSDSLISPQMSKELLRLALNIDFVNEKTNRDNVFFENFQYYYDDLNLTGKKLYGYFGLFHVFQYKPNNLSPFAAQIKGSSLPVASNMLSINFLLNDSYAVMPSDALPDFMRQPGKYSKMPISADNPLFIYIYGIQDFKRFTPENCKSLIQLTGTNSPYEGSNRMATTIQILPVTDKMVFNEEGKDYVQFTVFIRNSDWAKPRED